MAKITPVVRRVFPASEGQSAMPMQLLYMYQGHAAIPGHAKQGRDILIGLARRAAFAKSAVAADVQLLDDSVHAFVDTGITKTFPVPPQGTANKEDTFTLHVGLSPLHGEASVEDLRTLDFDVMSTSGLALVGRMTALTSMAPAHTDSAFLLHVARGVVVNASIADVHRAMVDELRPAQFPARFGEDGKKDLAVLLKAVQRIPTRRQHQKYSLPSE